MQKQEIARKELKKAQKTDILSFIGSKSSSASQAVTNESSLFTQDIGSIDSESIKILEKLVNFVDKDELFNLLATKPLKSKASKKAVRLMVIPNSKESKADPLAFRKKK